MQLRPVMRGCAPLSPRAMLHNDARKLVTAQLPHVSTNCHVLPPQAPINGLIIIIEMPIFPPINPKCNG